MFGWLDRLTNARNAMHMARRIQILLFVVGVRVNNIRLPLMAFSLAFVEDLSSAVPLPQNAAANLTS